MARVVSPSSFRWWEKPLCYTWSDCAKLTRRLDLMQKLRTDKIFIATAMVKLVSD
jgi:hypothetical protein